MSKYTKEQIERQYNAFTSEINYLEEVIEYACENLTETEQAFKEFKRKYPHPDDKGGSGPYGAWTFEDTLEDVRNVREMNNK